MLVLLTPAELRRSMANLEFEDPVPSIRLMSRTVLKKRLAVSRRM